MANSENIDVSLESLKKIDPDFVTVIDCLAKMAETDLRLYNLAVDILQQLSDFIIEKNDLRVTCG